MNPRGLFTLRESRRGGHELCEHGSNRRGNTHFGRFAIFDFSTPKNVRNKNFRNSFFGKNFGFRNLFSSFSVDFGGARVFLTSKSDSSRYFVSDCRIFRPVRHLDEPQMITGGKSGKFLGGVQNLRKKQ